MLMEEVGNGIVLPPVLQTQSDQTIAAVQQQLGEEDVIVAWSEGETMALEQAIELVKQFNPKRIRRKLCTE